LVVEKFPVTFEGYTYPHGRIAYVKGRAPRPVVLVHPNYAGLKQFDIDQACFLARAGYVGLAVDSYKESERYKFEDRNPSADDGAEKLKRHRTGAFDCMNEVLWAPRFWRDQMGYNLELAFAHPAVARGRAGAIGYCLGGQACLEQLRAGHQLQSIVTFHGLLQSRPMYKDDPYNVMRRLTREEYHREVDVPPTTCTPGCQVVIENGAVDDAVPAASIAEWVAEMDEQKVDWRLNSHSDTPHGWALAPQVTSSKYRENADRRSTRSMLNAFAEAWPDVKQEPVETNACGTLLAYPPVTSRI
jgi:dienelactone hydrolase